MKALLGLLLAGIVIISGCVGQSPQPTITNQTISYSLKPGVTLDMLVENVVTEIADCYYAYSHKPLLITSGTRTPTEQAQAMFAKLEQGDRLAIYTNQEAAKEIRDAYDLGKQSEENYEDIINAMSGVVLNQISKGVYISKHLRAGAVDISQNGMTDDDKSKFELCAETTENVDKVLDEEKPVHYHVQISTSVVPGPQPQPQPQPEPQPATASVTIDSTSCVATGVDYYGDRHYRLTASGTASGPSEAEFQLTLNPGYYPTASCSSWGPSELQTCKRGTGPESTSWSGSTDEIVEGATLKIAGYQIDVQARIIMYNGVAAEEVVTVQCPQ